MTPFHLEITNVRCCDPFSALSFHSRAFESEKTPPLCTQATAAMDARNQLSGICPGLVTCCEVENWPPTPRLRFVTSLHVPISQGQKSWRIIARGALLFRKSNTQGNPSYKKLYKIVLSLDRMSNLFSWKKQQPCSILKAYVTYGERCCHRKSKNRHVSTKLTSRRLNQNSLHCFDSKVHFQLIFIEVVLCPCACAHSVTTIHKQYSPNETGIWNFLPYLHAKKVIAIFHLFYH